MSIDTTDTDTYTDTYAVVGHPVGHSLSPRIHQAFARQTNQPMSYRALELPLSGFAEGVERFFAEGGCGLNVTVPFKQEAHAWVSELDTLAQAAAAVNTILPTKSGFLGCNTDGLGLLADLTDNLGLVLPGMRVLLLGAGGAAQGVIEPMMGAGVSSLTLANRTLPKAAALVQRFASRASQAGVLLESVSLEKVAAGYDLVINATAGSIAGVGDLVPAESLEGTLCYDMMYGPNTAFCDFAEASGASGCVDGLGMLVEQAAAAFQLWRGVAVETESILAELRGQSLARPLPLQFRNAAITRTMDPKAL